MASKSHILVQLLAFLFFNIIHFTHSTQCIKTEREALLKLKSGLEDPGNRLSSWVGDNCCSWLSVICSNQTGHVVRLNLGNEPPFSGLLSGEITPSLLALQHLKHLDLGGNNFAGIPVPEFIGSFKELTYLDLSGGEFEGTVPWQLGNISSLQYLDLSRHYDLSDDTDDNARWLHALGKLPSLVSLNLREWGLNSLPHSVPYTYFKSLSSLDLSWNKFNTTIPNWLFNITSLKNLQLSGNDFIGSIPSSVGSLSSLNVLDLSDNMMTGPLPKELGHLCNLMSLGLSYMNLSIELNQLQEVFSGCVKNSLEELDLSETQLTGTLPDWLGEIKNLKSLQLYNNLISGSIPESLSRLSSLVTLDLHTNSLNGVISKTHFANLTHLKNLLLSSNSLVLDVASDWVPPFKLESLHLGSCQTGPQFPRWLQTQHNLLYLDMSNAGISDAMPDWFGSSSSQLTILDLSNNQISGSIPSSLCKLIELEVLTVSKNHLSGELPDCWDKQSHLQVLSFSNNNFSGGIPKSICSQGFLVALHLRKNGLTGELPSNLVGSHFPHQF